MPSNNKTSLLLSSQVPAFVRDQHELFVQFMEYYYKFMEQELEVMTETKQWHRRLDVDFAVEQYNKSFDNGDRNYQYVSADSVDWRADTTEITADIGKLAISSLSKKKVAYNNMLLQKLYDQYIKLIPAEVISDKAIILKHAKDFYRSRGAEKSVRFLTRALFNKESQFYYPKVDVLKASAGQWYIQRSLKVSDVYVGLVDANGNMDLATAESNSAAAVNFSKHTVRGLTTNASATVETTNSFYENNKFIIELETSNQISEFENGEDIFVDFEENGLLKRVQATLFSGIVSGYNIISPGYGYKEGDSIPLISSSGSGAEIVISKVTKGGIRGLGILKQGAGFKSQDHVLFTGGGGIGAEGIVIQVDNSGKVHPNTYNVCYDRIELEANTPLGNAVYTNLNSSNANSRMIDAFHFWEYSNCGPLLATIMFSTGFGYSDIPTTDVKSNTAVRGLGILGRMDIVSGGTGYANGDIIQFINKPQTFGSGAAANVTVNATGSIVKTNWIQIPGEFVGGIGYDQEALPYANVISSGGSGANIQVSAILGDGESLFSFADRAGALQELTIRSGGSGYTEPPILDFSTLQGYGANANVTVVSGVYSYPGKYITDAGHVSAFNFLQDRDYYQNYSYVVRVNESINKYRKVLNDLTHPLGAKMFGEYMVELPETINTTISADETTSFHALKVASYQIANSDNTTFRVKTLDANAIPYIFTARWYANNTTYDTSYTSDKFSVQIADDTHNYKPGSNVYLSFIDPNSSNLVNGIYTVQSSNLTHYRVPVSNNKIISDPPNANGQVMTWSPVMSFFAPGHGMRVNDKTRLVFRSNDANLGNGIYYIKTTSPNWFTVEHNNVAFIVANTGNVNVYTDRVTVRSVGDHGFDFNEDMYIRYTSGDTSNGVNAYYTVIAVPSSNQLSITVPNVLMQNTKAILHTKQVIYNDTLHGMTNTSQVNIICSNSQFTGIYPIQVMNANTFYVTTTIPMTANGTAHVYKSTVVYNTATITRKNHGFETGNVIYTFFDSGIVNTFYTVSSVANSNTFNISGLVATVNSQINMVGNVEVGLYK